MAYEDERPPLTDGTEVGEVRGHYRWSGVRWILIDGATVGEVRDGYRWDGTRWVPVDGVRVGEIRDGHRWNGTKWVPVADHDRHDDRDDNLKKLAIALGVIAALALLGWLIWSLVDDDDDDDEPAVEPTPIAQVGDPVQDGDLRFVVVSLQSDVESLGTGENAATADGSYTLVNLRVTNTSGDPVGFSSENVDAIDTEDNTLDADADADLYAANGTAGFNGDIAANQTVTTTVAFDVADDATIDKIVVHEPASSDGQEIDVS